MQNENTIIDALTRRIQELEAALRPFAQAADGFKDGDIYLEYRESDGSYVQLYQDNEALQSLTTQNLINAANVMLPTNGNR